MCLVVVSFFWCKLLFASELTQTVLGMEHLFYLVCSSLLWFASNSERGNSAGVCCWQKHPRTRRILQLCLLQNSSFYSGKASLSQLVLFSQHLAEPWARPHHGLRCLQPTSPARLRPPLSPAIPCSGVGSQAAALLAPCLPLFPPAPVFPQPLVLSRKGRPLGERDCF